MLDGMGGDQDAVEAMLREQVGYTKAALQEQEQQQAAKDAAREQEQIAKSKLLAESEAKKKADAAAREAVRREFEEEQVRRRCHSPNGKANSTIFCRGKWT